MDGRFDRAYYERYYHDPASSVTSRAEMNARARLIGACAGYLGLPVKRLLDAGCGVGMLRAPLRRALPGVEYTGVEVSEYLCRRYGWTQSSVETYRAARPFDLVICYDVVQYLDDTRATRALANLARLCRGLLYFSALTRSDWYDNCDRSRTDRDAHLRSGDGIVAPAALQGDRRRLLAAKNSPLVVVGTPSVGDPGDRQGETGRHSGVEEFSRYWRSLPATSGLNHADRAPSEVLAPTSRCRSRSMRPNRSMPATNTTAPRAGTAPRCACSGASVITSTRSRRGTGGSPSAGGRCRTARCSPRSTFAVEPLLLLAPTRCRNGRDRVTFGELAHRAGDATVNRALRRVRVGSRADRASSLTWQARMEAPRAPRCGVTTREPGVRIVLAQSLAPVGG